MEKTIVELPAFKLIGLTARTSNAKELDQTTAKIGPLLHRFIDIKPQTKKLYCAYTDYASDAHGEYSYFVGVDESEFGVNVNNWSTLSVPAQKYIKFTTLPGVMPQICIDAWQKIWHMSPDELGGERNYNADFEIYDERAIDLMNTVLDIYIGVK